jgi:hypothetical protein
MDARSQWYMRVDDATGEITELLPVEAGQALLTKDMADYVNDNIGVGGAKNRLSVAKLKTKAKAA